MKKYTVLTDPLYDYLTAHSSDAHDPVYAALRAETLKLGGVSGMAISAEQCGFFTLLVAAMGARQAVEIGTFTGSSSLSIARGLPPDGRLTCFDASDEWTSIARRFWQQAGVSARIELRLGDAAQLVPAFVPTAPIDFVFIDADKSGYDLYYEALLPHVRPGGVFVFDNMFRGGDILTAPDKQNADTRALDQLNRKLAADPRVYTVMLPIADGLQVCRKR